MAWPAGKSRPETSDENSLTRDKLTCKGMARRRLKRDKVVHPNNDGIHDDVEELLAEGFSLTSLAALLNVNITELMRWRSTAVCRPEEEKRVVELLAVRDMLLACYSVHKPVEWFEDKLAPNCVINMQEIYANGRLDLVLDYAAKRKTAEQVLDIYEPAWREVPPSMWEVATHPDGSPYIRMKGDGNG